MVSSAQVTHRTITSIQWVAFEFARVMTVAFRFKWVLCWKHKGWYVPVCSRTGIWMCTRVGTALYSRLCWGRLYTRIVKTHKQTCHFDSEVLVTEKEKGNNKKIQLQWLETIQFLTEAAGNKSHHIWKLGETRKLFTLERMVAGNDSQIMRKGT